MGEIKVDENGLASVTIETLTDKIELLEYMKKEMDRESLLIALFVEKV